MYFRKGDRVRIDIPDQEDPDFERFHGEHGAIIDVLDDDAGAESGDTRDSQLYRVELDRGETMVYKLKESQMPRLTAGDDWFEYISERAARLNCYGEAFAEMRERLGGINPATDKEERKRLQAEIDAAACHAYGLNRDETAFVLNDFHRVQNPRLMTDDYFELVLKKYDALADQRIDEKQEIGQ